jgi:UTP--glucose-1-phosphate uridylyltransferase
VEKPDKDEAPTNIAILGRYILTPEIFKMLESTKAGVNGEIQLTDGLKKLCSLNDIYAYVFEGRRYDVGSKLGFLEANLDFALKNGELREGLLKHLKTIDIE